MENAIKLFIALVLFREKDKENKIKSNRKNLIDYLKTPDLWDEKINICKWKIKREYKWIKTN